MALYGIFGIHSVESCPLNNAENRNLVIKMAKELDKVANRNNTHILHRYHSGLEHICMDNRCTKCSFNTELYD